MTIALTTLPAFLLDAGATRGGRLSPRLELSHPNADERRILFERAIAGVPQAGDIDVDSLVARTSQWTGAEIDSAVEEAMRRSLLDGTDALRMDLLIEVLGENHVVEEEGKDREFDPALSARHEAGHAIYGHLVWPGRVASMEPNRNGGLTKLSDEKLLVHQVSGLRSMAGVFLAGMATDFLFGGHDGMTKGAQADRVQATKLLRAIHSTTSPFEPDVLEGGDNAEKGSERMRAAVAADIERAANALYIEVIRDLSMHRVAIERLAEAVLAAPGTRSGAATSRQRSRRRWQGSRRLSEGEARAASSAASRGCGRRRPSSLEHAGLRARTKEVGGGLCPAKTDPSQA